MCPPIRTACHSNLVSFPSNPPVEPYIALHLGIHRQECIERFRQLDDQGANIFVTLIEEDVLRLGSSAHNLHIRLNMDRSAYVMGGYITTLDYFDRETDALHYEPVRRHKLQRIFAINSFGASHKPLFSYVTISGSTTKGNTLWIAKVLALDRLSVPDITTERCLIFVQNMECIVPRTTLTSSSGVYVCGGPRMTIWILRALLFR